MKLKLLYSIMALIPSLGFAQEAKFKLLPYINGITTVKEGLMEGGLELNWNNIDSITVHSLKIPHIKSTFTLRPTLRLPLTNKAENVLQVDRFTSTWRGILMAYYTVDNTESNGRISRHTIAGQFEYGHSEFKYFPTGSKTNEKETGKSSYGFEVKYIGFHSKGAANALQISPQFRLRYSYDWKAAKEVGVVNAPNTNGVTTTSDLVIEAPLVTPTLSPAFSLQIYPGKNYFSYSPSIYYDFVGKKGSKDPLGNLNRLRLESWVFFYPSVTGNPNVKIGVSPFLSIRTLGTDDFNKIEYGGLVSIRFGTSFLQFL